VESATTRFAEVQSAYEVLSDPQERAWYDSHRDSILRGDAGGSEEDYYQNNQRLTSARDIVILMSKFNSRVPFTDLPDGFYGGLRIIFETLAKEEDVACDWDGLERVEYPDFGNAADRYEDVVRPFYRTWMNFSTKKSFSWKDAYRASDAPDRPTRRLIEKENKRLREEGIREFNDAVKALVVFMRKRDPRYIPNSQTEADRQKILREATAAQAARSRAANLAKLDRQVIADWAKTKAPAEETELSSSSESDVEHIECVVCQKIFKTEKSYEAHEKSKKHIKAVQILQREMRKENELLNLDKPSQNVVAAEEEAVEKLRLNSYESEASEGTQVSITSDLGSGEEEIQNTSGENYELDKHGRRHYADSTKPELNILEKSHSGSSETDDEYAPREAVASRLGSSFPIEINHEPSKSEQSRSGSGFSQREALAVPKQKLGKAKAKRAKKAAKQKVEDDGRDEGSSSLSMFASNAEI